jgi:hypothetical protein
MAGSGKEGKQQSSQQCEYDSDTIEEPITLIVGAPSLLVNNNGGAMRTVAVILLNLAEGNDKNRCSFANLDRYDMWQKATYNFRF